ncbi:hypothetical protein NK356_23225 [Chryseobacterium sp. S0630]|nr:hypothetical protein [Chryseobacterium sp. S0630]
MRKLIPACSISFFGISVHLRRVTTIQHKTADRSAAEDCRSIWAIGKSCGLLSTLLPAKILNNNNINTAQ